MHLYFTMWYFDYISKYYEFRSSDTVLMIIVY